MYSVEILQEANAQLGEGPTWDENLDVLYWGDLKQHKLYRYDPVQMRQTGVWQLPYMFGCIALTTQDNILAIVTDKGYELLNLNNGSLTPIIDPEQDAGINCYNDGKVDPQGRFWVGSLPLSGSRGEEITEPTGKLYSLETSGDCNTHATGIYNTNGLAWSPDEKLFYHIDSWLYTIWVYDFDSKTGSITNKRELIQFDESEGGPDGMTIDIDGNLWVAMWDGWCIQKVSPNGQRLEKIKLPVQKPTSCTFGGKNMDELFITSASCYLSADDFAKGPSAGALLRIKTQTSGLKSNRIADKNS